MSDVMNDEEFDALAAEYVLGTLDAGERTHAQALLGSNQGFVTKVKEWEGRLGELHLMVEPVEPDWQVWERVKTKIGGFESNPFFRQPAADGTKPAPEPEQAAPVSLPPAAQLAGPSEPRPPEPAVSETEVPTLVSPAPVLPETAPPEPEPVARGPELAHTAAVLVASRERTPAAATGDVTRWRRSVRQWQALALLMTLVALVLAGFVAALRNFPDRLPSGVRLQFQATAAIPPGLAPPAKRPAPPLSQFDE
jgi:hypothetical protein